MTQGILNPVDFRSLLPLLPAEQRLVECLREGKQCKIGDGGLPTRPIEPGGPGASMPGNAPNVIRGEVIRYFALGGGEQAQARGSEIVLGGAWIQGEISLLNESTPYALSFAKCHFDASIALVNAECRSLHIRDSRLAQGLFGDGLRMAGGMFLRNVLCVKGEIRLVGAQIGGNLEFLGGEFQNPNGYALVAANAKVGGSLIWRVISGDGVVNLAYAKAGVLADDLDSWKPFKVVLDGFAYDQFAGLTSPTDAKPRIEWLANRPSKLPDGAPLSFSPLPYEQAAKVLRAMGKDIDAWDIEREKNRLQRESDGASPIRKLGGWFLDTLKDAVYRPLRTVKWAASVVALGVAVFAFADYHGNIVPTDSVVALSEDYKAKVAPAGDLRPTRAVPPEYPAFNPVVFSLDVFTPSAVFHQEDSWGPRSGGGDWLSPDVDILWLLTGWYWFQVAAGWVLVPLFLLSVTGVLRPRQSSGEKG